MTDNAIVYRNSRRFRELLASTGARHIRTPAYTPRWNGKVERFIQTLQNEWAYSRTWPSSSARARSLLSFLRYYNRKRRPPRAATHQPHSQRLWAGQLGQAGSGTATIGVGFQARPAAIANCPTVGVSGVPVGGAWRHPVASVGVGGETSRGMASAPRLGERRRSFAALYEHWERHQWSPLAIDFSVDAVTFAGLDRETRERLVWVYAHRFHAEFNVAELLAPFLLAAPDYDIRLLLATQVADEYRHVESVLRVYSEVFGVKGGIEEVKALADSQLDAVAAALYDALDGVVRALDTNREEDTFLRAVIAYHVIAEGSIGRANQRFVAARLDGLGGFPGLVEVQRLAVRDELRHLGIGVSYARHQLTADRDTATAVIAEIVNGFRSLGTGLLLNVAPGVAGEFVGGYGAAPEEMWAEVLRELRLRLRSIGYAEQGS